MLFELSCLNNVMHSLILRSLNRNYDLSTIIVSFGLFKWPIKNSECSVKICHLFKVLPLFK